MGGRAKCVRANYKIHWDPVLSHLLAKEGKPKLEEVERKGGTQEWSEHLLREKMGASCYEELIEKREKPRTKAVHLGPRFWAHPTVKAVPARCVEYDAEAAYTTLLLHADAEEENDCALRHVQGVVRGFLKFREEAAKKGDSELAAGFKLAGNSFLGALAHIAPRIRDMYVKGLYKDMELAKTAALGVGLQCVALISDSMIFASTKAVTEGTSVDLTDDQVGRALASINAATVCTFRLDKDYANLVIVHSQCQFGQALEASQGGSVKGKVHERGIVASLGRMPQTGPHLLELMHYVIQKLCGGLTLGPPPSAKGALEEMIQREEAVDAGGLKPKEGLTVSNLMVKERLLLSLIGMQPPRDVQERSMQSAFSAVSLKRKHGSSSSGVGAVAARKNGKRNSSGGTVTWQGAGSLRASAAAWGILL